MAQTERKPGGKARSSECNVTSALLPGELGVPAMALRLATVWGLALVLTLKFSAAFAPSGLAQAPTVR